MTNIINRNYLQTPPKYFPTPKQFCISGTISILSLLIFKNKISKYFEILNHKTPKFNKLAYRACHVINASLTFIITGIVQKIFEWRSSVTTERTEEYSNPRRDNSLQEQPLIVSEDTAFVDTHRIDVRSTFTGINAVQSNQAVITQSHQSNIDYSTSVIRTVHYSLDDTAELDIDFHSFIHSIND